MAYSTAAVARVPACRGRSVGRSVGRSHGRARGRARGLAFGVRGRALVRRVIIALGSLTAVATMIVGIALVGAVLLIAFLARHHHVQLKPSLAFQAVALTKTYRGLAGAMELSAIARAVVPVAQASTSSDDRPAVAAVAAIAVPAPTGPAQPVPQRKIEAAMTMPLPAPRPPEAPRVTAQRDATRAAAEPDITGSISPSAQPALRSLARTLLAARETEQSPLPRSSGARTAIYDIEAHVVYLPNGERLEAHSGLGEFIDDTRYVNRKARGATPPNVYDLTMRESLFHGVEAIRLKPVDDEKMYGRDGILAHPYMLGPSGQSFGCVSFKDYQRFLRAFKNGEVDRLVVVPHLDTRPSRSARRDPAGGYAFN